MLRRNGIDAIVQILWSKLMDVVCRRTKQRGGEGEVFCLGGLLRWQPCFPSGCRMRVHEAAWMLCGQEMRGERSSGAYERQVGELQRGSTPDPRQVLLS